MNDKSARWLWIGASGAGAFLGAHLALLVFPDAGFARNPTGQIGWNVVEFTGIIGICYAVAQCSELWTHSRHLATTSARAWLVALWLPATAAGIAMTILPIWRIDALTLVVLPFAVFLPMLPGAIVLSLMQWAVLRYTIGMRQRTWIVHTILGVAAGSAFGWVANVAASLSLYLASPKIFPLEAGLALVMAGCISGLQAEPLLPLLREPFRSADR